MKALRNHLLAPLLTVLLLAAPHRPAYAGPANPRHDAADAKWNNHLDFEAAKQTALYAQVLDIVKAQFPLEETVAQLKQFIGVNPLTDITAVTIYNNSFEKDVAAVLIYAKVDRALLLQAIAQNPDYKEIEYGKHTINQWTDNNDGKTKVGSFHGDGLIVMGDKLETVKMALDVLDGAKPADSPLVKEPAKGAFLYASADLAQSDDKNVSQLLSNSEAATAYLGERDGNFVVSLNLAAKTPEQANQLKSVLDGVKAFGQLGARELPTAANLISKVQVAVDGNKVVASFTHDSKTLLQTLKKLDEENKAKQKKAQQAQ
jgi:hypothetical protein